MDILIFAPTGGGKKHLAQTLAKAHGGIVFDATFSNPIPISSLKPRIRDSHADVIIFGNHTNVPSESLLRMIQELRKEMGRDLLAIYCILEQNAGISIRKHWMPGGFVSQPFTGFGNPLDDEIREVAHGQLSEAIDTALLHGPVDTALLHGPVDDEVAETPGPCVKEPRTKRILLDLMRDCAQHHAALTEAQRILRDYDTRHGLLENIDPSFYPGLHDRLRPVADWALCARLLLELAKSGRAASCREVLTNLCSSANVQKALSLLSVPFEKGTELLNRLKSI